MTRSIYAIAVLLFLSCTKKETFPKDILPPAKMQEVFWDYLKADAYTGIRKNDPSGQASIFRDTALNIHLQNIIFKHHHISREEFYRSYQFYMNKPELMKPILDSIDVKQQKKIVEPFKLELNQE
jgi:hypothetical protein